MKFAKIKSPAEITDSVVREFRLALARKKSADGHELKKITRRAVIDNKMFPVFTGSALKNIGVQLVLDAVVDYLPSPLDMPPIRGIDPNTGEEIVRLL